MKLTIVFLTTTFLQISLAGYGQKITLSEKNASIEQIFRQIRSQTGYDILCDADLIKEAQPIDIQVKDASLVEALEKCLKGQPFTYTIKNNTVIVQRKPIILSLTQAPPGIIKGKVSDNKGITLPAVTVKLEGASTQTTVTDANGNYSFTNLSAGNYSLTFTYLGFTRTRREVSLKDGQESIIDISLLEEVGGLAEVVVTALGIGKDPKSITYATQNIVAEELTRVKDVSFVNSLAGKVAGAVITKGNFGPGSATKILMRGDKSFTSNSEPLYVVDGAPMFGGSNLLANINPEDIESIQVMKGASAAALYGSQAANGVVLVTTKKGKAGIARVDFSSNFTTESAIDLPELQTNYGQTDIRFNDSWGPKITNGSDKHLKEFFKPGTTAVNSLSVSNGNEFVQIYLSYANTNAKGILPDNDLNRHNLTTKLTTQLLNKKLSLDASVNYTNQKVYNQNAAGGYSALPGIYSFPTGDDFSKYSGSNFEVWDATRAMYVQNWPYIRNETFPNQNPYWVQKRNLTDNFIDQTVSSLTAKYKINNWLTVQGRGIYDKIANPTESRTYATTQATVAGPNGGYALGKNDNEYFYSDLLLTGNTLLNDSFSLTTTLGASNTKTKSTGLSVSSTVPTSLTYPNYFSIFALNGLFNKSESSISTLSQAIFGNAVIGFKEKIYLDVTARNEWSSTVSQSFFYPSAGLSYVLLNKPSSKTKGLTFAKLNGSYAEVGKTLPFGIESSAPPYSLDNSGNIIGRGALPYFSGKDTINLQPERTKSFEFGADLRFLGDRLSVNLTYYRATTFDQVFQIQAPAGAGATNFWINGGTIRNQGVEGIISLRSNFGQVNWTSSINFSGNKNQIRELSDLLNADYFALGGSYREASLFLTRPKNGKYGSYGDLFGKVYLKDASGNYIIGTNGLPTVSANFDNYVGNANSNYLAGFNNSFSYKKVSASFLIDGRFGGKVYNRTEQWLDYKGLSKRTGDARDNGGVNFQGKMIDTKAFYMNQTGSGAGGAVSGNLYDVTNIRLRELAVGYNFPKIKGVNLNLSLVGRNLFFFYKNAPFDPEIAASTSQTAEGISSFTMPSVRSFGLNLNAKF
ncbi:MAG TPA: SusC/RagA family TonB-linked outer membrane protein [Daejeonella sp.]|uniref:SusC/RagA family TonB-linked outer membrane protein n=1 Tax=Daejeonella sp. TaxID=2805397 RepID=UPI002EDA6B5B